MKNLNPAWFLPLFTLALTGAAFLAGYWAGIRDERHRWKKRD